MTAPRSRAREAYHAALDHYYLDHEEVALGPWTSESLKRDPKHLAFVLSRYKFCAKLLEGKQHVVEIGSGDGFGLPIVAQAVGRLTCIDWDRRSLDGNARRLPHLTNVEYVEIDLNERTPDVVADAAFSIDVIEHIEPELEERFVQRIVDMLTPSGVLITGTPNVTASQYASGPSRAMHINLKTQAELRELMERWFENVFCFGQNDEVVHTGFPAMCHYIWTVAAGKRDR